MIAVEAGCERLRDVVLTCSSWGSSWSQCASERDETGAAFANSKLAMCQLSSWLSISLLAMPLREARVRERHSQSWLAAQQLKSQGVARHTYRMARKVSSAEESRIWSARDAALSRHVPQSSRS